LDWYLLREWGPPYEGGWRDWPAGEFARARAARNVYLSMKGYRDAKDLPAWADANPQAWELVTKILDMRTANGNG